MVSSDNTNAIKNKLLQDVKFFQDGNLRHFSKTEVNTRNIQIFWTLLLMG